MNGTRASGKAPGSRAAKRSSQVAPAVRGSAWQALHQTLGNQSLQRLLRARAVQAKLRVNRPNDPHEQEAERVSESVMRMPEPRLQRACACGDGEDCPKCRVRRPGGEHEELQTKRSSAGDAGQSVAPPVVYEALAGPGQPLDPSTRRFMEPRFGRDFSQVRVHTGAKAAESARALDALAYTAGRAVVFDAGQYQPHTSAGRRLLAHELSHTVQQGAAPRRRLQPGSAGAAASPAAPATIQRAMKFELQTRNIVKRTRGTRTRALPRKFGPKDHKFLHKGTKGKPAKAGKEGTAIELQSEAHGFVEFETPSWHRDWCDVKERIQEAVDMVDAINKSKVIRTVGTVDTVEFPFDVKHLKKTKAFPKGLRSGESLEVEILDPTWTAKIQASEAFELPQFESYLTEHMTATRVTEITGSAKKILDEANTKKIPDKDLVNLYNFLQIIIEHVTEARLWDFGRSKLAKENISLMSRTSFSSMYRKLLSKEEQKLFKKIVKSRGILKELGATRKTRIFPSGFTGRKSPGPTIHDWLVSIHSESRDLLSDLGGDNRAMGRFPVETKKGKKDTNLVKFEARATSGHVQERPVVEWLAFAEEVFKAAHTNRARTGSTELTYEPAKC